MKGRNSNTIICVECGKKFRVFKIGVPIGELDDSGKIFRVWMGDVFHCPNCGVKIIYGLADMPVHEECNPYNYNPQWKSLVQITFS